uniref:Neurochondrin n=1 Tax=Trichuris muris TaxID=70415 RepID=A0A5S6QEM6_TRIMR
MQTLLAFFRLENSMEFCRKLEAAETASDMIAALMTIAKLVPQDRADDIIPEVAAAVKPKFITLILNEDPVETGGAGIVILSRLLADTSPEGRHKYAGCFQSLIGCLEKISKSGVEVQLDMYTDSLFCLKSLYHLATDDEKLFSRISDILVKFYPHCREKVIEVAVDLWFVIPRADMILAEIVAIAKNEVDVHVCLIQSFNAVGIYKNWIEKMDETKWLEDVLHVLGSLMRGKLRDEFRWQAVISVQLLIQIFSKDVLLAHLRFLSTAVTFASVEIQYLINLGSAGRSFNELQEPIVACAIVLKEVPEMFLSSQCDRHFKDMNVPGIIDQLVSTVNFILAFLGDDEEEPLPAPVLNYVMSMLLSYLCEAFELLDKDLVNPSLHKMFSFWEMPCQQNGTTDDLAMLTTFMQCVIENGSELPPEDVLQYAKVVVDFCSNQDLRSDDKLTALLSIYCDTMLQFRWNQLVLILPGEVRNVFYQLIRLLENGQHPTSPYVPICLVAICLRMQENCRFEMTTSTWQQIIDEIRVSRKFLEAHFADIGRDNDASQAIIFLRYSATALLSLCQMDTVLQASLSGMWRRAFPDNDIFNGLCPIMALSDLDVLFAGNETTSFA